MSNTIVSNIVEKVASMTNIPKQELDQETELYDGAIISSLNLLDLMAYVEENFKIHIRPEELIPKNFKDIKTLADFIDKKISA